MPFTKVGKDDYTSPSGRHFNEAQVRLWHANGGKFPGQKHSEDTMSKGSGPQEASYAHGGTVLGRSKDFLKTPDRFREQQGRHDNFGKGDGKSEAPAAKDKSITPVKPRG